MQTQAQFRLIDPVLTQVAQGYKHPDTVGHMLFPEVDVDLSGGQVLEFGRESFRRVNARRTPGTGTKRIQYGYAGKPYALVQDALEGKVPYEHMRDASRMPGIDLGSRAVKSTMKIIRNLLEIDQAAVATNAANYGSGSKVALTGSDKWSHADSDPTAQILEYKETVRKQIGIDINTLLLSADAFYSAQSNVKLRASLELTHPEIITVELLKKLWDIPNIAVGKGVILEDDNTLTDTWGNNAILAYVEHNPSGNEEPSYGYTYKLRGHPHVEESYSDRNEKSWIYPVTFDRAPVLSGISAGFLIQNPK